MRAYAELETLFARLHAVEGAAGILGWDAQTLMPEGAAATRADQLAALKGIAHDIVAAARTGDLIAEAGEAGDAHGHDGGNRDDRHRQRAVREMRTDVHRDEEHDHHDQ